ncbi:hypothetical protein GCM10007052_22810 [Halioglobus japonicus]|uniref:hypothetical protein n=1 Tax=Halioglobus japonicus TaxID=930805 RepID=UPI0011AFCEA1|nr:hypothetical protein [Halioglobus japonicus]GHD16898.1 hypothetical protein GCM10007052_22810 [Halioglobus japonicus]
MWTPSSGWVSTLSYNFSTTDQAELSLGFGVHAFDTDVSVDGRVFVGDNEMRGSSSSGELLAPLPNIRGSAFYAFSDKLSTFATLGWMSANVGEWSGSFTYLHWRLHYAFSDRWGLAAGT